MLKKYSFSFYRVINEANKIINNTNPIENPQNAQDENINDAIGLAMLLEHIAILSS